MKDNVEFMFQAQTHYCEFEYVLLFLQIQLGWYLYLRRRRESRKGIVDHHIIDDYSFVLSMYVLFDRDDQTLVLF